MARQSNNRVMQGTRGMFGKQIVFKVRKGRQIVAAPPDVDEDRVATPNQQKAQDRFKRSTEYASEAILDPDLKKAYKKVAGRGQTAQNMAIRDAYNPPEVLNIITQGYTGAAGNIIVVHAVDDFKVTLVRVSVFNQDGVLIEVGNAVSDKRAELWVYTSEVENNTVQGCTLRVIAYDLPGNEGIMEVML